MSVRRWHEAVLVGAVGGGLAAGTGALIGVAVPAGAVGAVHGALAGYRRIYPWQRRAGVAAFVLDHSWALATSTASLVSHAVATISPRASFVAEASERQGRHVYVGGFRFRPGFVMALGNTINGLQPGDWPARRRLVEVHENSHVWQARLFGPLFPVLYVGWIAVAGSAGLIVGLTDRGSGGIRGRVRRAARQADAWGYYCNPFEWWAYSRDGRWPPSRPRVWRRPLVSAVPR